MNAQPKTPQELALEYRPYFEPFPIPQESPNKRMVLVWEIVRKNGVAFKVLLSASVVDITLVN